jgi:hypothetical protein
MENEIVGIRIVTDSFESFLPREKTSTNGVNGEKNRKVTLDFWLAAWHRFC